LTYDIAVDDPDGQAIIRGEGNVFNGIGRAQLPASGLHYWDGHTAGSFGAHISGSGIPKRNLIRNGDLKYWGGFPDNVPNWSVTNTPIIGEETADFVTGTRSARITQNLVGLEGLQVGIVVSDPGIRWVTIGCRYKVIAGTGFFFAGSIDLPPRQFADPNLSNNEWQEGHLEVPVNPGATLGTVSIIPSTGGEVLVDEVWAVPGRFAVDSTQYGERVELLETPIQILSRSGITSDEIQGPVDITNLQNVVDPPLAGLAVAPRGVVGCLLRADIVTHAAGASLLESFHFAYVDIPGDNISPAQTHRVYSHWGEQPNEEVIVIRSTEITGGYEAGDNLSSDYAWQVVGWVLA